jgi:transcription antitermination factor NusG
MEGERPLPCPGGLVEGLQALVDERGIFNVGIAPGDVVRVVTGPFAELVGTLVRLDGAGRARVLLQMMRSEVAVILNMASLVPMSG